MEDLTREEKIALAKEKQREKIAGLSREEKVQLAKQKQAFMAQQEKPRLADGLVKEDASAGDKYLAWAEGISETASIGLLPYMKAGVGYATGKYLAPAMGLPETDDTYEELVDEAREETKERKAKAPGYATAGNLMGFVAPGMAASKFVGKGVSALSNAGVKGARAFEKAGRAKKLYQAAQKAKAAGNIDKATKLMKAARIDLAKQGVKLGTEGALLGGAYTPESGFTDVESRAENAALGFATGMALPFAGQALKKGGKHLADSPPGQGARKAVAKVGSTLTGVASKEIDTFIKRAKAVNETIKRYGDDISEGVDELRTKALASLNKKRMEMSSQITKSLDEASPEKVVDASKVTSILKSIRSKLSSNLEDDAASQIDDMISRIETEAGESGKLSLGELFKVKEFLQSRAKGAYSKNGQLFTTAKQSQRASKQAAAIARKELNKISPDIAKANNQLSLLHKLESEMQRNLLKQGAAPGSILAAGSGANPKNAKMLQRIGKMTGEDILGEAENLASARTFGNPPLLPQDATGKSLTRMAVGGGLGYLFDGPEGAAIGAAFTSPFALKKAIQLGRIPGWVFTKLSGGASKVTQKSLKKARQSLQTPQGRALIYNEVINKGPRAVAEKKDRPKKGKTKWAYDGIDRLIKHVSNDKVKSKIKELEKDLVSDPRAKELLIAASSAKPGSKAMDQIFEKLSKIERRGK